MRTGLADKDAQSFQPKVKRVRRLNVNEKAARDRTTKDRRLPGALAVIGDEFNPNEPTVRDPINPLAESTVSE